MDRSGDPLFTAEYKRWQRINIENTVTMLRSIRNLYGENVIRARYGGIRVPNTSKMERSQQG